MVEERMDIKKLKNKKTIQELLEFGIINFDKWANCTSFDVVDFVKKRLGLRKTSHFGTLDPMVTGVLPIALNRAVKLTGFFIGEDKTYHGTMRMHAEIDLKEIEKMIKKKFLGKIIQMPPVKSSVKRQLREREVRKFELLGTRGKDIDFIVECEGGTYIRKLVHDLGEALGIGAHMIGLRRLKAGIFSEPCVTREHFENAVKEFKEGNDKVLRDLIIPAEVVSEIYPIVEIKPDNLKQIFTGKPIHKKDLVKKSLAKKGEIVCVFCKDKFVGMYKVVEDKEVFAKAEFVMQEIRN